MTSFSTKAVAGNETLGAKLKRVRDEARISLEQLADRYGIQPKYLEALEAGRYDRLPGEAYIRNFLKVYAATFHVNLERVYELYERERRIVSSVGPAVHPPRSVAEHRAINLHRFAKTAGFALIALALVGYLGFTIRRVIAPPMLSVHSPATDFVTSDLSLAVQGVTERETVVRINGQEVFTDPNGSFSEQIALQPGLNVIRIAAKKERSREHVVYRQIIVKTNQQDGPQS